MLYVACAALGGIALAMSFASAGQAAWFLVGLTVVATIALWKLGYFRLEGANEVLLARRRNVLLRGGVRRVGSVLRSARSHTDIQRALRLGAKVVGATDAVLEAGGTTSTVKAFGETEGAERLSAQFSITGERLGAKHLDPHLGGRPLRSGPRHRDRGRGHVRAPLGGAGSSAGCGAHRGQGNPDAANGLCIGLQSQSDHSTK